MSNKYIDIGAIKVGRDFPSFIIAELSANHAHDFNIAAETIRAAKKAGADAIKVQTYTADTITINSDKEYFRINQGTLWDGRNLYDLYKEAYMPWEWQPQLKKIADELGLIFFSSPFDFTAVDFLEEMNVPLYKVASFEITDIPLVEYVASKKKPVIISTGIATKDEIGEAIEACQKRGNNNIILLKCTSEYPAPLETANLLTIPDMVKTFNVEVGLSDHTIGWIAPAVAVGLGACVIEKHFILDRSIGGPDAAFSMEPDEFYQMVQAVRDAEKVRGKVDYNLAEKTVKSRKFARSLFVVEDIKTGEKFTYNNVKSIRPADGLAPKFLPEIIGKTAKKDLERGTPLRWDDIV
jgi:pseudaminic acid synthase